ncbi:YceI family protein [Acidihalobacter ferrooxydans]|uniref:Lipid/polyisoprenoid-binding YceI-like domain-containing protein n=1 Tax=Acidihalobacter ferrooxydans TaxID=1765967 RepID=A0A1P8UDF6_9GAMM|nr:YceI family protein [Acidihalobacter ferrooxydans]APZ41858.1 hypothetical protein BW247_01050 [Acidihalobacter ferrooxydans]
MRKKNGRAKSPWLRGLLGALALTVLAGCASQPPTVATSAQRLPPAPKLPVQGATAYHVVRADSQLRVLVYRAGPLAAFGHNHVITTTDIQGTVYVQPRLDLSGFDLRIPLKSFVIDIPAQRVQEGPGFGGQPSRADRAGTRKHMLGPVLDVARYPVMTLRSLGMVGPPWYPRVSVRVTLHGVSHDFVVPTAVFHAGAGRLVVTGGLALKQSDFGIKPFTIFNGALSVRNRMDVSFHLVLAPKAR